MATYNCNIIQSIKGKEQISLFFDLCREIGIKTLEDVAFFIKNEVVKADNIIEDLKCYALELKYGEF